ncbi:hypothetical protein HK248_05905, partial [Streptococcus agalactiae]|nr:hypothetical protein [Streptococcus agalactiae]
MFVALFIIKEAVIKCSTVFDGLTEVQDAVSAGLNYVSEGFGNFNGTFDTSGKGLDWTKTIKTGMEKRRDKV